MYQEIGSGGVVDALSIANLVEQVPDNTRVMLQLDLTASPAAWIVNQVQNSLISAGVPGARVTTGSPVLNISWINDPAPVARIALDPLTAIAIIVAAVAAVAIVVIGWRMYEEVPSALQPWLLVGGLILAGGLVFAYIKSKE